jgi:tetratricopeptide (TPR) repeat protein
MAEPSWKSAALVLAVLVAAAYASSIDNSFHFDDAHSVEDNPAVHSLRSIPSFWTDPSTSSFIAENRVYRPLTHTVFALCWWLGDGATEPFHLAKMAMHWGVCLAFFLIWARLWRRPRWFPVRRWESPLPGLRRKLAMTPGWVALLLACLFAVHPACAEVVNCIAASTSLQATLFFAWAFWAYLVHREDGRRRWLWLALALYGSSVASKEIGITLVAVIFIFEVLEAGPGPVERIGAALRRSWPFVVAGAALAVWIGAMLPAEGGLSREGLPAHHYLFTQWRSWLWYMRLWFWPAGLNADTVDVAVSTSMFDAKAFLALLVNLGILAFALVQRRRFPALLFGLLWFWVTLSPTSSVVSLAEMINERRLYLPLLGFAGGTSTLVLWLAMERVPAGRRWALPWLYLAALIALFAGTQVRNAVWHDDASLWRDTLEKNPGSSRAINNLATVYMKRGDREAALGLLERCREQEPRNAYCAVNHGIVLWQLRRLDEAEKSLRTAHRLIPGNANLSYWLGRFVAEVRRDAEESLRLFRQADEAAGGRHIEAKRRMIPLLLEAGRREDADKVRTELRALSLTQRGQ